MKIYWNGENDFKKSIITTNLLGAPVMQDEISGIISGSASTPVFPIQFTSKSGHVCLLNIFHICPFLSNHAANA